MGILCLTDSHEPNANYFDSDRIEKLTFVGLKTHSNYGNEQGRSSFMEDTKVF